HLPQPDKAGSEIVRILNPGGYFLFRTGNLRHYAYAIAASTPHWFHELVANRVRGMAGDDHHDPYPTYYKLNTQAAVRRILSGCGLREVELITIESEPSYLMFSVPSLLIGTAYERTVNNIAPLAGFRQCLFGCFRKS